MHDSMSGFRPVDYVVVERPGYFGRKRDQKLAEYDAAFGAGNWKLGWQLGSQVLSYEEACRLYYEYSYLKYLKEVPDELDFICSFQECIDNAPTNVQSGLDYTKQEAFSTHIQDIAMRNVLDKLDRSFTGERKEVLVIRSTDSNGYRYGPGVIPFAWPELIRQPSLCPRWAHKGSVEDFWQSNKVLLVKRGAGNGQATL